IGHSGGSRRTTMPYPHSPQKSSRASSGLFVFFVVAVVAVVIADWVRGLAHASASVRPRGVVRLLLDLLLRTRADRDLLRLRLGRLGDVHLERAIDVVRDDPVAV